MLNLESESVESDLWKKPSEPILEKVAQVLSSVGCEWYGSLTALVELLGVDMKPNALTLKLNINAGRLYNEYGIRYENKRCHDERKVTLTCEQRDDV